ncbi:MAG: Rpn family recombination-promoting nuclease/putative transposase [Lachnospiraceae bacterium]|nr:Rpn family recombination-promoting nuclease/putative transposase [Lachnospiraceae bacterium]
MKKKEMMNDASMASGPVAIRMTNDYLFRALLQRNNKVLKGLICSLLHLSPKQVKKVKITNPIELGKALNEKTFVLDVKVLLNNDTIINLEMQVVNEHDWPERSLSYLCRSFDNLNQGEPYRNVKPVVQIGLLDFTLFPESPEFFSTYRFLNVKNYTMYSDKMGLSVVDLTQIDLATEEDKHYGIDHWAALFKSTTWEEIKMLAQKNDYIKEASDTIYQLSQEEKIRQQCEAREDYYRRQRSIECYMQEQKATMKKQAAILKRQERKMQEQSSTIQEQSSTIQEQSSTIQEQSSTIQQQNSTIYEQNVTIAALRAEIEKLKKA